MCNSFCRDKAENIHGPEIDGNTVAKCEMVRRPNNGIVKRTQFVIILNRTKAL